MVDKIRQQNKINFNDIILENEPQFRRTHAVGTLFKE